MDPNALLSSNVCQTHMKWVNGFTEMSPICLPSKRKRNDVNNVNGNEEEGPKGFPSKESLRKRGFVLIDGQRGVYYSESWEPNGSTLYLPVNGTLLANIEKYDQISFEQGCFCIGNAAGGFQQKVQGQAIHCWRYSERERKLFIALSYLFTNLQVFQDVVSALDCL
ncbi:uncharacterized protein si:dkey-109l4.3 [Megalobrama amblycephala]|uniref:uncharacterized protein si:dkey-109l4.3 n=1 Tax=Megalobrama amblycephala TaxID=75352 RepID=UPI002014079B|nr:uncharacterized protein si:dkey-109l4.3 [Megalobrama amblycephala]